MTRSSTPINTKRRKHRDTKQQALPKVVSREEWRVARESLLAKEKAATRARDALNAERRRLPMVKIEKDYVFDGPKGQASLLDLFEGRRQLIIYHFMYHADEDRFCDGCSAQEDWEDSPEGWPQTPPYEWWRYHDSY